MYISATLHSLGGNCRLNSARANVLCIVYIYIYTLRYILFFSKSPANFGAQLKDGDVHPGQAVVTLPFQHGFDKPFK